MSSIYPGQMASPAAAAHLTQNRKDRDLEVGNSLLASVRNLKYLFELIK